MADIVNTETTTTGKLRAVCECCDKRSRSFDPKSAAFGPTGWACAPYPAEFVHRDGSAGRRWTCPACIKLRRQRQRDGIRPLLAPSPRRAAAIASRAEGPDSGERSRDEVRLSVSISCDE